jgi:hypothetical protein
MYGKQLSEPDSARDRRGPVAGAPAGHGSLFLGGHRGVRRHEGRSRHRARLLTREMVESSTLVVAMARRHKEEILRIAPGSADKVIVLGDLDLKRKNPDIEDPIGGDEAVYRRTRDEIAELVFLLIDYIAESFK